MSTISGTSVIYDPFTLQEKGENSQELDRNAFLNLLITQMQYQDPMKPMENREFIAQLAQFSALEQMQQMREQMMDLAATTQNSLVAGYLGRTVTAQSPDDDAPVTGTVRAVTYLDGNPYLVIGEREIEARWVTRVE